MKHGDNRVRKLHIGLLVHPLIMVGLCVRSNIDEMGMVGRRRGRKIGIVVRKLYAVWSHSLLIKEVLRR